MHEANAGLVRAFPAALRDDAVLALSAFPEDPLPSETFAVRVAGQTVALPYRIYHNPTLIDTVPLNSLQKELVDCLLTRHHDGFVREEHLKRIISRNHVWIPAFVIQLVGEYVIAILHVIRQNVNLLDTSVYREFLEENPKFLAITKQRVDSYWNCYYRTCRREEYVGFQLMNFLQTLVERS
jgi:hypothetical protein